ncbi:MAG TPA: serine hydrolase domain-containing protein [Rhizomicrobium sp.]
MTSRSLLISRAFAATSFWAGLSILISTDLQAAATYPPPLSVETLNGKLSATLDADARAALQRQNISSSLIVEIGGKVVLKAGYGWANRERRIPFTTRTIAQIDSLSKQFTAMAVVALWQGGKVDFSKPVKAYLPQTAEPVASVTLDQLLTHTSGMPLYCGDDFALQSKTTLLSKCAAKPLAFRPGSKFAYSNPEYSILGVLVEKISGESLDTFIKQRFFKPIGMHDTGYDFPDVPRGRFALGYLGSQTRQPSDRRFAPLHGNYWNAKGNAGMQASPDDMQRWYHALSSSAAITPKMLEQALRPRFRENDDIWSAYGWNVRVEHGRVVQVSHSGSDDAFLSYFYWRPYERTFLYFVSNSGTVPAVTLLRKILEDINCPGGGRCVPAP